MTITFTKEQLEALDALRQGNRAPGYDDKTMLETLIETGDPAEVAIIASAAMAASQYAVQAVALQQVALEALWRELSKIHSSTSASGDSPVEIPTQGRSSKNSAPG